MTNKSHLIFTLRRKKSKRIDQTYLRYRELARDIIKWRLDYWVQQTTFTYNRVAIRNQKRRWGSCSSLKNLNFNYKIIFLPYDLADYIIVHELCHLEELHHGEAFWSKVAEILPDYRERRRRLRQIEKHYGTSYSALTKAQPHCPNGAITLEKLRCGTVSN